MKADTLTWREEAILVSRLAGSGFVVGGQKERVGSCRDFYLSLRGGGGKETGSRQGRLKMRGRGTGKDLDNVGVINE